MNKINVKLCAVTVTVNAIVNARKIIKYGYMIYKILNSTELKLKVTLYFWTFKLSSEK